MNRDWNSPKRVGSVRELNIYKMAFETAMRIFNLSKLFPTGERFALTDQIKRSSRSVCSNLAEAWRKRQYMAVFKNKLSDCCQEAAETQTWLEFALNCGYINQDIFNDLDNKYEQIFAMLIGMERKVQTFCK
jgi:four helix bundle protein